MECPKCQHENPTDAVFCVECGTALELKCSNCGSSLEHGFKFCKKCGQAVAGQAADPAPASQPQPGERRQATVLFSDLSGFTAMTEKLDPEEVQGLMRRLKDRAVGIVESHGGIVSQFVGDEVLALFGILEHSIWGNSPLSRYNLEVVSFTVTRSDGVLWSILPPPHSCLSLTLPQVGGFQRVRCGGGATRAVLELATGGK